MIRYPLDCLPPYPEVCLDGIIGRLRGIGINYIGQTGLET